MRSLEMIEQGSKSLLKHGKGLQCWVFDPGDDQGSIILQDLDLRTNPFEGREDGVILSRLKLKGLDQWYERAKTMIKAWLNGQFQGLIGMIYEVLDREKRRILGTASKQLGQRGFTKKSLTGAIETILLVQLCMENKEIMSGSFWIGLDLQLREIRIFRPKKRVATRILIHLLSC